MTLRNQMEYAAIAGALKLSCVLPESWVYALFRGFASAMFAASGRRRRISLHNMEIAFPEKSADERKALAKKSFINLSESMAFNALVMAGRISNEQMMDCVEVDDWDKIEQACSASDKGLLVFSGHLGNWEFLSQYLGMRCDRPCYAIARKSNNKLLEDRIIIPLRERFGMKIFYKKNAMLKIVKVVKRGGIAGILIDQHLHLKKGIAVEFFGKEAGTTATPALLQIRFDITTLPIFMVSTGHKKYRFLIGDAVQWTDNGKPMEEQIQELTQIHQKLIEDMIRQYPDQWFWMHNRWGLKSLRSGRSRHHQRPNSSPAHNH